MTPRARWAILAFAAVGLAFAGGAAYVHYRLLTQPNYISPCDINARFNCSDAYLSRYGSFHGVPVALGGVIWFAAVALLAALSSPRGNPERGAGADDPAGAYLFVLATIGLACVFATPLVYFAYDVASVEAIQSFTYGTVFVPVQSQSLSSVTGTVLLKNR